MVSFECGSERQKYRCSHRPLLFWRGAGSAEGRFLREQTAQGIVWFQPSAGSKAGIEAVIEKVVGGETAPLPQLGEAAAAGKGMAIVI